MQRSGCKESSITLIQKIPRKRTPHPGKYDELQVMMTNMGDQEVVQKEGEADTGAMHRTRVGQGAMVGGELSHGTRVLIAFISLAVLLVISVASVTGSVGGVSITM